MGDTSCAAVSAQLQHVLKLFQQNGAIHFSQKKVILDWVSKYAMVARGDPFVLLGLVVHENVRITCV